MDIVTYKMAQKYTETAVQNVNNAVTELDNRLATNSTEILRRALITETGNKIELEINNQTYILTAKLYDKNNNLISTSNSIDLPLEAMIINATYNNNTKKIVLTLQSGSTVEFSIADLIDGLVNETTFNETIEELEAENIKLKQRISDLENNESINTVSGESIDIDDSANATIRNIKITGKSIQDGTPTPENPVEIQNCSGSISFKLHNKNLAWNGWAEDFAERINNSYLATITTKDNKRCLKTRETAGYGSYDTKYLFKIDWKENTQYAISCKLFTEGSNSLATIAIVYTDGIIEDHRYNRIIDNWTNFSLISEQNKTIKYLIINYLAGCNYIDLDTFMVEESSIPTTYIPHEEQNITFPLQEGQVLAQDDYLADDGIHHNRKTIEITSENVNSLGLDCHKYNGNNCVYIGKTNLGWKSAWNSQICLINKYKEITATSDVSNGKFAANFVSGSLLVFDERFTSINVVKELLIGTIIEIKQAQEIIEPYTEQQAQVWEQIKALRTYKNETHISSEDETKPTLEVTYVKDLPKEIDILGHHVTLTQAQYDALVSGGTVDSNTFYYTTEDILE